MLDDLRRSEEFDFEPEEDESALPDIDEDDGKGGLVFGMTAVERMFIAIFLFMNVTVLGLALLLATNRISF